MLKIFIPSVMFMYMGYYKWSWAMFASTLMLMSLMLLCNYSFECMLGYKSTLWSLMDSLSFPLIMVTLWISSLMFFASLKLKMNYASDKVFLKTILLLNLVLLLSFTSSNIIIFYVFFEASLIPTMFLVMKWGYQPERLQASLYLMMYTVMASLPMLICIFLIFKNSMTLDYVMWFYYKDVYINNWFIWFFTILGFLVKLPMYMTHLWLPKAHVEAPVAGSMILAAILLKLGGYGIIRLSMMYPWVNKNISSVIMSVSLMGGILTSMICLRQSDMKSLIAYSSVSHMGFMVSGAVTSVKWGFSGAMVMMIAHAFSSSALFILANMNYEITSSRSFLLSKGALLFSPVLSLNWFLFTIMNMAAPPTINLLSEILLLSSILSYSMVMMFTVGMVSFITVAYSLFMYSSVNHCNSNQMLNPYIQISLKDFYLLFLHFFPSLILISKSELLML